MFKGMIKDYLASLSSKEIIELFGGAERLVQILIEGFKSCSSEEKEKLQRAFFGEEIWRKLQKMKPFDDFRFP